MRNGFWILAVLILASCQKDRLPPMAICSVFPTVADTSVLFELDASKSVNNRGFRSGLSYRWDFEADGIWDTDRNPESGIGHRFLVPGMHKVVVEVSDYAGIADTASVVVSTFGRNQDISTMTDPRDGRVYRIAKFRGYWWMCENLNYGKVIDPMENQANNGIVEQYHGVNPSFTDTVCGLYDWREAMNHNYLHQQGICPPGWHIPSMAEWNVLLEGFPMLYATRLYGFNGLAELNLQTGNTLTGFRESDYYVVSLDTNNGFWTSDYIWKGPGDIQLGEVVFHPRGSTVGFWISAHGYEEFFLRADLILAKTLRCIKEE